VALTGLMKYWRPQQPAVGAFFGKQAVNLFQQTRANLLGLDLTARQAYIDSRAHTYRELADLLISTGRLAEAEQVLGLIKEQEFFEFVRRAASRSSAETGRADLTPTEVELLARYREISDRIMTISRERAELSRIDDRTEAENQRLTELDKDLAAANVAFRTQLTRIVADLGKTASARAQVNQIKDDRSLMADLRKIDPGAVVVYTLITPNRYHALLMTADARKAVSVPVKAETLNRRIFAFRQALQAPGRDPRGPAHDLYQLLVAPIARDLVQTRATTVLWVLDGMLRHVPMAALHDGERYLAESYRSVVVTPASKSHLADVPGANLTGFGAGVSRQLGGFAGLPAVKTELHNIFRDPTRPTGVMPGRVLLDDAFTAQAFHTSLRERMPVVHIASHFQLQPGSDLDSFLLLGDGTRMTLRELDNLTNLFEGVELLTLSACNTAVGNAGASGNEIESFGVIAQRQGARAVVSLAGLGCEHAHTHGTSLSRTRRGRPFQGRGTATRTAGPPARHVNRRSRASCAWERR
jgi:CHAT domain-containing protein